MLVSRSSRCSVFLIFACLPLLLANECSDDEVITALEEEEEEFDANVRLSASGLAERECIHLFGPGETFPCCQVCNRETAATRRSILVHMKKGNTVIFTAGRNEQFLASTGCRVAGGPDSFYEVRWSPGWICGAGFE